MSVSNMANRDSSARTRRLKITPRMPESEVPQGNPADWLTQDDGKCAIFVVSFYSLNVYMSHVGG